MEKIQIKNTNGQNIAAVVHRPAAVSAKLAILCPGYLDTKDYEHLIAFADELVERGYTAIRFDPTGTWESEGAISEYLTSQYLKDIKSVLEHMLTESAYEQVLLGGHSRGGQVSILYAVGDPRITTVLGIMPSQGPIYGSRREAWERDGVSVSSRDVPGSADEKREFRVPVAHMLDRDQFDVVAAIRNIRVPVVLVAGALDTIVPPEGVQELYEAANEPKIYLVVEGIGHNYRLNAQEIQEVNRMVLAALPQ